MNLPQWMACESPWEMLGFVGPRTSERKRQLFAAACCRSAWSIGPDRCIIELVEAAERCANGLLSHSEFERLRDSIHDRTAARLNLESWNAMGFLTAAAFHARGGGAAGYAARFAARGLAALAGEEESEPWHAALEDEERHQCAILRDIIGDPFRPFQFDPDWLAGDGLTPASMAKEIEDAGRFHDLGQLAKQLEKSGCKDSAALDHCRSQGPHVLGCWVIDALLDRESAVAIGLMTEADWRECDDPTSLLHFLKGKGTLREWRLFEVACCRRLDHLIEDLRYRMAIQVAARYCLGNATDQEVEDARVAAQEAENEAKHREWTTEAEEQFCVTPRYAAVSRDLFVTRAIRSALCRDVRYTDADPGTHEAESWAPSHVWAAAAARWEVYAEKVGIDDSDEAEQEFGSLLMTEHGKLSSGAPGLRVQEAAAIARAAELRAQCEILQDLFGDHLGPPGDAGDWIPCGDSGSVSEWWCRLPTPRNTIVRPEWLRWSGGAVLSLARAIRLENRLDRLAELAEILEQAGCDDPIILSHLRNPGPHYPGCWVIELLVGGEMADGALRQS